MGLVVMGWDVDDYNNDDEPKTFQQAWLADLAFCERFMPDRAAKLKTQGPPPPMPADGYWGRYAYLQHNAATDPQTAEEFERLKVEGPPQASPTDGA
ncbi:hypothetical protein IU500_11025 [Nocardia terpenica]|uniref:hypothetical protein n=1 Tax=Nocardia terpenica TaxID=455432 RepID=UPI001894217E|nr:hypothetical protein [Nocardia terpenica]MBF6062487.1 hypothetical protein [Nocardia terpenica]MBF6104575.1 hypothetical protein [Nocardia terpenica]MBF6109570.1 hypothetical protein [Nocardia terpenica]MBF6119875.1 hypothetical protein [Nocardia terpenica]MBF6152286.1 hypothetical protein [Nocardia terpenica]